MSSASISATLISKRRVAETAHAGNHLKGLRIMQPATTRTSTTRWSLAPAILALTIAAVVGGATIAPAEAQDGRGRDRRHEQVRHDRYHSRYGLRSYGQPTYVYAPPPVYYAQPAAPPVIDFVFPLHFR
jgi:hypothetical protein